MRSLPVVCCAAMASGLVLLSACNSREPMLDSVTSPTAPATILPAPPAASAAVSNVSFNPGGLMGGDSSRGTVTLTLPAPPGGMVVALSSNEGSVSVPPAVTVAAGRDTAQFTAMTQSVSRDTQAIITGSASERSASGPLHVWTILPVSFTVVADAATDINGRPAFRRFTPDTSTFSAWCSLNGVYVQANDRGGNVVVANFIGPPNRPLTVGTYETPLRTNPPTAAAFSVNAVGLGCVNGSGRFVVEEADFTRIGDVRRFSATFEQHCSNAPSLRGEVKLVSPPRPTSGSCMVP